ncbi:flippase-like domain-containing protein [candidate division KSB1 bacterium]|nr:flippase-like domain-containing protein [candidate division KSB1 bacterium]
MIKISVAFLALLILLHQIQTREIWNALVHARQAPILLALLLLPVNIYLHYRKWALLVRLESPKKNAEIFYSLLAGFTLGFITPGRVGEYGRGLFLHSIDRLMVVGLTLLEKIYALLVIYFFGTLALVKILPGMLSPRIVYSFGVPFLLFLGVAAFLLLNTHHWSTWFEKPLSIAQEHAKIQSFFRGFFLLKRPQAIRLGFLSLLHSLTYISQFVLLLQAFAELPLCTAYSIAAATLLTKTLVPITVGDLGVRELAAIFFCSHYDIAPAAAFDASILLFGINILLPSLIGLAMLVKGRAFVTSQKG